MINLTNSEYQFSYYENLYASKAPVGELDINELIEIIKYGYLKKEITKLRATKDKDAYRKLKTAAIPAVMLSGIFTERYNKGLQEHSGLIQIDIDHVENYNEVLKKIIADSYTYVAFKSPGGEGIKAIVKINPDETTHLEQFYALEQYYKNELNIEIDKACKDISRCLLLSYDPDIYCNPFSEVFEECYMPEQAEEQKVQYNTTHLNLNTTDEQGIIEQIVSTIEQKQIDITHDYETWIKLAYSLSTVLGESGRSYFHRLSAFHPEYNQTKCDKQYSHINKRNNGSISLGTLIYFARQNNIEVNFPKRAQSEVQKTVAKQPSNESENLFKLLKEKRAQLAKDEKVSAFIIFKDATLLEMCETIPETPEQFGNLKGVGKKKVEKYANHFLPLIQKYKGIAKPAEQIVNQKVQEQKSTTYQYNEKEKALYENLREMRLRIAKENRVKPFWIFSYSTLSEIVQIKPLNKKQLKSIKGIGQKKIEQFGKEIIAEVEKVYKTES